MERTKSQLCTWFTDSLCGNHTDSLTKLNHLGGGKVTAVTLAAYTLLTLTGEHRTDLNHLDTCLLNGVSLVLGDLLTGCDNHLIGMRIDNIVN